MFAFKKIFQSFCFFLAFESFSDLVGKISSESGKNSIEIKSMIDEKLGKFSGLLTEEGAALMVARELNIELGFGERTAQPIKVNQLSDGMKNVDVRVNALHVFPPKNFEKNGKKGQLCNLLVGDDSGEIRLTLWHDDVKKIEEKEISRNSVLLLKNCYVSAFNGKAQLSLGYNGSIVLEKKADESNLVKISSLSEDLNNVDLIAKILRIYEINTFKKESGEGKVLNFELADETGKIRATAWNDLAEIVKKTQPESVIKIEGAYTKKGLKALELHLGWKARIMEQPKSKLLLSEKIAKKKISELELGETIELEAKVLELLPGKLFYKTCPKCGKKAQHGIEGLLCENCGGIPEAELTPVVSARITDDESEIIATFFGSQAEQFLEIGSEKLEEKSENQSIEEILTELGKKLENKKITIIGRLKENKYTGEKEIIARNIVNG